MNDSYVAMAKYLQNLLELHKIALGLSAVYYGDQNNIPSTPTACIDPGGKRREFNGAPRRTLVTITNYVIIYHNPVKSLQATREEDDLLAEVVETRIHADPQMSASVIDSMVTSIESGYLTRNKTMFRASRLTIEARAQVQLPSSI